ncbi:MAG TPA: UdgX family uracil-DNA binding protein [Gemmatimonadaceae bacterium]
MATRERTGTSALEFLPERITLENLREAARHCRGCPLYQDATQTVFGRGPRSARLFVVGEVPGNDEDLAGEPFVGPAGRVLDEGLDRARISRDEVYLTNVVKHFKFARQGKRRIHKTPTAREIAACVPWLEKELEVVQPEVLLCLGATAAQALLGRDFRVTTQRGQVMGSALAPAAIATVHPSSILRRPTPDDRRQAMAEFVADLRVVRRVLDGHSRGSRA